MPGRSKELQVIVDGHAGAARGGEGKPALTNSGKGLKVTHPHTHSHADSNLEQVDKRGICQTLALPQTANRT